MKALLITILLFILSNACDVSSVKDNKVTAQSIPNDNSVSVPSPTPANTTTDFERLKVSESANRIFKSAPKRFECIDFQNYSYPYRFSYGKQIGVALKDGKYEYNIESQGDRGWFSFSKVYYIDLTNDEKPEAIAVLGHVSCGVSCDGGSSLIYIFEGDDKKTKTLWSKETGTLAFGCGLKSFVVENKTMTLELFGNCLDEKRSSSGTGKYMASGITRQNYRFNGRKFALLKEEFTPIDEMSVMDHQTIFDIKN